MVPAGALILVAAASAPQPATEGAWYGYQTLIVDGVALGLGNNKRCFPSMLELKRL